MKPKRGDQYSNQDGIIAELTVPLVLSEDEDDDADARFTWGAFLIINGSRIAHMEPPYHEMCGTPTWPSLDEAAAEGHRNLQRLGWSKQRTKVAHA